MVSRNFFWSAVLLLVAEGPGGAQTSHSLITGAVVDGRHGDSLTNILVRCENLSNQSAVSRCTGTSGEFTFSLLSRGTYRLSAEEAGAGCGDWPPDRRRTYRRREVELDLPVAGRVEMRIELWPLDDPWQAEVYRGLIVPGARSLVRFYGPDIDTSRSDNFNPIPTDPSLLESAVSYVLSPSEVRDLPLAGRDAYTALVLQPGVTADTPTARGLGFSVNGQRSTATHFLLDGVENNNLLTTGPLVTLAPEAIQEFRLSTHNFLAEYGGTSGVVANVVSRAAGNEWHGLGYFYLKNDLLNANDFVRNARELARPPVKESQPGFQLGGSVRRNRLFASLALETFRFRSVQQPVRYRLPAAPFIQRGGAIPGVAGPSSIAGFGPDSPVSGGVGRRPGESGAAVVAGSLARTAPARLYLAKPAPSADGPGGDSADGSAGFPLDTVCG